MSALSFLRRKLLRISPSWSTDEESVKEGDYMPLADTLRLYAGWLLAWYALIFALGFYQSSQSAPVHIPLVDDLFRSPLILDFACLAFLYLLLSDIHKRVGRGMVWGVVLLMVGVAVFVVFKSNV